MGSIVFPKRECLYIRQGSGSIKIVVFCFIIPIFHFTTTKIENREMQCNIPFQYSLKEENRYRETNVQKKLVLLIKNFEGT